MFQRPLIFISLAAITLHVQHSRENLFSTFLFTQADALFSILFHPVRSSHEGKKE
jgi:hypothetical protein